jgi:hypothetical protein
MVPGRGLNAGQNVQIREEEKKRPRLFVGGLHGGAKDAKMEG